MATNAQEIMDEKGDKLQEKIMADISRKNPNLGFGELARMARTEMERMGWRLVKIGNERMWVKGER